MMLQFLLLLFIVFDTGSCIVTFSNENNMYSCINNAGNSTSSLISLGRMSTLKQCEAAFENYTNARSFVYYLSVFPDDDWVNYCYIRTDTYWSPVQQDGIVSGQIDNFYNCRNDQDCELNGKCGNNGKCECKPAWTGNFCEYLNFKIGAKDLGYQRQDRSQWGLSSIYDAKTNQWNGYAVEMMNECGIDACCGPNSQIVRATSDGDKPGGPYTYQDVAVPWFAHEPMIVYSKQDDLYLLYHWGKGDNAGGLVTGCKDGYTFGPPPADADMANMTESGQETRQETGSGSFIGGIGARDSMETFISYSKSLDGPWSQIHIPGDPYNLDGRNEKLNILRGADELCLSNPYIYDNGSILMVWTQRLSWERGSVISLVVGNSWNTTYNFSTDALWVTQLQDLSSMEDPFLWRDANDDTFHLLMHGMIEIDNPNGNPWLRAAQGRHAYSNDGYNWFLSPHYTYNTTICYDDGDCVNFARRERPHLIFDPQSGEALYLTNGMQLNNLTQYDKTFSGAVGLYTSKDYCEMGKTKYCK